MILVLRRDEANVLQVRGHLAQEKVEELHRRCRELPCWLDRRAVVRVPQLVRVVDQRKVGVDDGLWDDDSQQCKVS